MDADVPFRELSRDELMAIVARHGLGVDVASIERLPSTGIINSVYALGSDYVLRVPRAIDEGLRDTRTESVAVPIVHAVGVRTPALIAFDDSFELLDVPYTVYERVPGTSFAFSSSVDASSAGVLRSLGRELAVLHQRVDECPDPNGWLDQPGRDNEPEGFLEALRAGGYMNDDLHAWLRSLIVRLVPAVQDARGYRRFLHDDASPANVMVDHGNFAALIDWGDAGWGDPALEFRCLPTRAVPQALAGYREVAPFDGDATAEARILYDHVMTACYYATRTVNSEAQNWGRPPVGRFVELLAFATEQPDEWARWVACGRAVS